MVEKNKTITKEMVLTMMWRNDLCLTPTQTDKNFYSSIELLSTYPVQDFGKMFTVRERKEEYKMTKKNFTNCVSTRLRVRCSDP